MRPARAASMTWATKVLHQRRLEPPAVAPHQAPRGEPTERPRIDDVLGRQYPRGQRRFAVTRLDRYLRLQDHRPAVELRGHEMHAGAVRGNARSEHAAMRDRKS